MAADEPGVPPHIDDTIMAISELTARHHRDAHPGLKRVAAIIGRVASPLTLVVLTLAVTAWIGLNLSLMAFGRTPPDPPPFAYLDGAASLAAIYLAAMIVITQKHEGELASHRAQLTLQLAIISDHKSAKIIRLLEQQRRNDPYTGNEPDQEAEAMATPADPQAVLAKLHATQSALLDDV
jgi:uncharacterized membrane protein